MMKEKKRRKKEPRTQTKRTILNGVSPSGFIFVRYDSRLFRYGQEVVEARDCHAAALFGRCDAGEDDDSVSHEAQSRPGTRGDNSQTCTAAGSGVVRVMPAQETQMQPAAAMQ